MMNRVGKSSKPEVARGGEPLDSRVLICIPTLGGGGAERQVRLLAPRLAARGIQVALFSRMAASDVAGLSAAGVACVPIRCRGNHDPRLPIELARAAASTGSRIVHSWLTQMDVAGGAVALATGRRWILSERCASAAYAACAKSRLRARLGRHADLLIANSPFGLEVWPDRPARRVIGNGIDFAGIAAAPVKSVPGRTVILSARRLDRSKRIDLLLHALVPLRREIPDVLLVLAGEGREERALKALAARLGVGNHVLFAGFQAEAWSWIKGAAVGLSASAVEGHPNAVLEAAAAGTPLVLSDIAMHRSAVGPDGALFRAPEDSDAFAGAIVSLIRDPERARTIAAAARKAVEPLSIDRAADLYADLYRRVAAGESFAAAGDPAAHGPQPALDGLRSLPG